MYQNFPSGYVVENPPASPGDMVRSLDQEDPTCHGATKPTTTEACVPRALRSTREACTLQLESSPCPQQLHKAHTHQRRSHAVKNKLHIYIHTHTHIHIENLNTFQ